MRKKWVKVKRKFGIVVAKLYICINIKTMAKTYRDKITKEQVMKMERAISRNIELERGRVNHHKAHKMATDYNRQKYKQFKIDDHDL